MILFYSEYCQHCNILLETIKRHDKNNLIKLISIDVLRSLKKPIDPKIHSVPALLLVNTKEYLFGKAVFDHLLLPNRGVLFTGQLSRDDKKSSEVNKGDGGVINGPKNEGNTGGVIGEPGAFSLGSISSDNYASIDDDNFLRDDANYKWDFIQNHDIKDIKDDKKLTSLPPPNSTSSDKFKDDGKSKLPSMEDIMKQRAMDIK